MSDVMRCDEYLGRLTAAVESGGPLAADERAALEAHASRCVDCAGTVGLLDESARTAAERDRRDDPGDRYWAEFSTRLSARLERERAGAAPTPRRRRLAAVALVAAALVAFVLVGRTAPDPSFDRRAGVAEEVEPIDELRWVAGWGGPWEPSDGADGLFPELDGLDPEGRAELLDWLEGDDDAS